MLDLYLIEDDQPNYSYPDESKFAGGLDYKSFERLKRKGLVADRFEYYSDFRWGTDMVKR